MKKDRLIPKEKKKSIIYLDKRGGSAVKRTVPCVIFAVLSVLCLLYCFFIALFIAYGTKFFFIWGFLAILFGLLAYLMAKPSALSKIPKWFRILFVVVCIVGMVIMAVAEGMILGQFHAKAAAGADYCVILGAEWKENGPSYVLKKRLDAALAYLNQAGNENTKVVVSGGQGSNEVMSEADGMRQYLLEAGIAEERILVENTSVNTYENLTNSRMLIEADAAVNGLQVPDVVIVTSNFHVFRACMMAKKMGYPALQGLAAGSYPSMLPNNMLREFFGIMKDLFLGRIL